MADDPELTETERRALHELTLGIEHIYRGYGDLLDCHHQVGRGMNRLHEAERLLRGAGHGEFADALRDDHLPSGAIEDMWTYELVDTFYENFLTNLSSFEGRVRDDLADGERHITEREQQREWRERARDRDQSGNERGGERDA
ncbi:hypothetical protein ACFQPA_11385 [Halomarina halobia]|uniref:Uncharacterized protein n=1 Tax=Halomarina halobia TaxID=3033386 RepID=A0ABD6AAM2_9EURY|nr:hypothetical protein [Halomarina sp. PSR21]